MPRQRKRRRKAARRRAARNAVRRYSWARLPDEQLLKLRLKDLNRVIGYTNVTMAITDIAANETVVVMPGTYTNLRLTNTFVTGATVANRRHN